MATSRRRERELARRRFERRRQAELERRARTKRRNTVLGAVIGTVAVIVALVLIGISVFGGSSAKKKPTAIKPLTTPTAAPSATPAAAPAPKKCAKITPDPPAKGQPSIPQVAGKPPKKLVTKDIKVGHGRAAKKGDSLEVYYIGASCATGKVFDASYLHQPLAPLPVTPLGQAGVIAGFNQGLIGIRTGGVRELVIPPALAYQDSPQSAPTGANDTLIFLVTAKSVKA